MERPIYLVFTTIELSKFVMYETCYDKFQSLFGQDNPQLPYMDCDIFILSIKKQNILYDIKSLEDVFDFNSLKKKSGTIQ